MKLSTDGIRYSASEIRAFAALGRDPLSTTELVKKIYGRRKRPFNDRLVVLGIMNRLIRKVAANKESFIIKKSKRNGPYPVSFWISRK